jgi:hypothetical protein
MLIDCDDCRARGPACSECVVGVLLARPEDGWEIDDTDRSALGALADVGLVPRLRHQSRLSDQQRAAGE